MPIKNNKKKISKFVKIFDPKMWFYDLSKWVGALSAVLFFRVKRIFINEKKPKKFYKGNSVIIANHEGYLDPLIISVAYWPRRCGFVATSDLFKGKFTSVLYRMCGCIEVNKKNVSVSTFKKTTRMLNYGHNVIVFPEGGIIKEENNQGFKSGAVMMALLGNATIIPMYIVKREKWWKRQIVIIGEKFNVKDYLKSPFPSVDDLNGVTKLLEQKEQELKLLSQKKR